jgi:hypothetical protein
MTAVVRHSTFTNTTGAAVVAGGASLEMEKNYSAHTREITLAAADVGNAAGQTQNAAGMLVAEVEGADIKRVVSVQVFRLANNFLMQVIPAVAADPNLTYGTRIIDVNGVSTLRLLDSTAAGAGRLAAGDIVVINFLVGN